jgi:soluble lytic murein transglycosylase
LALALCTAPAFAQGVSLPPEAPLPELRPFLPTNPVAAAASTLFGKVLNPTPDHVLFRKGIEALAARDIDAARKSRDGLKKGSVDQQLLTWAIALSGDRDVSSKEITEAIKQLNGWPGLNRLGAARERALYREDLSAKEVAEAFAGARPQTFEGLVMLVRAHLALDDPNTARALISPYWRIERLSEAEEKQVLKEFGTLLSAEDHRLRTERMLYADRLSSAERAATLADATALVTAWKAVERAAANASTLIVAVPAAQRTSAWSFLHARHLRRTGKYVEAADVLMSVDPAETARIDPDAWWVERRVLSRELIDVKEDELAYKVAAAQTGGRPVTIADAEFHAGWYALRFMDDPIRAAGHFKRIADIADGPISLARAHYWIGRAAEAGAPELDAIKHYTEAAANGTTFYGQLAAAKLGRTTLESAVPTATPELEQAFAQREPIKAILKLQEHGYDERAGILYRDLAEELQTPEELAELVRMAEADGKHYLALRLAKAGSSRGMAVGGLAHPVGAIPDGTSLSGAGEALAYAIARQESEFNVGAVSGVGALGLLQLMPGTAREMARKTNLPFSALRLTSDAAYNATLGTAYLDDQLARFGGSYILTFIGYNAGPTRASQWIERYGDPRGKPVEQVIDWIERIPFTETRGYVQRVLENYQVYKMHITGRFDIEKDLVHGR